MRSPKATFSYRSCIALIPGFFIALSFVSAEAAYTPQGRNIGFSVDGQAIQPVVIQGQGSPALAQEPVVEGFGDKVPLTVALQQILPQGYGYTLGDGVDPGQLVSWRGGRPWAVVLQDMAGSSGLVTATHGQNVTVGYAGAAPAVITGVPMPARNDVMAAPPVPAPMPVPVPQAAVPPPPVMLEPPQAAIAPQPVYPQPVYQQQPVYQAQPPVAEYAQQMTPPIAPYDAPINYQGNMPQPAPQPMPAPMPEPQPMVQQAPPPAPPVQAGVPAPQPLQIENPLIFVPQVWEARPGQSLRGILQEWSGRVGAELHWSAEYDYPMMASFNMSGTFEEAVRTLLSGFDAAKPTPRGRFHFNPAAGQAILIVEASGNNYGE